MALLSLRPQPLLFKLLGAALLSLAAAGCASPDGSPVEVAPTEAQARGRAVQGVRPVVPPARR